MTRLHVALLLALILSALFLVKTSYESRRLFAANQRAELDGLRIEQEFQRLDAQRQINATNPLVAREAQSKLRMKTPVQKFEVYETATSAAQVAAPPALVSSGSGLLGPSAGSSGGTP